MPKATVLSMLIKRSMIALVVSFAALLHAVPQAKAVATGQWGGEHVVLQISEKGAEVEFDCARGEITQPITPDKHGDFDVVGTFTSEHGGPVRRDEHASPVPARYSGHVDGDAMSITVTLGKENVGVFALTHGASPRLTKCR